MIRELLLLAFAVVFTFRIGIEQQSLAGENVVIDANDYLDREQADCGFQNAIELAAAKGGGTVRLPAGEFSLRRGLILKDGVRLVGAGMDKTILTPARRVQRLELAEDLLKGDRVVLKRIPDNMKVGSAVVASPMYPPSWKGLPRPAVITAIDRTTNTVTLKAPYGLREMKAGVGLLTFGVEASPVRGVRKGDTEIHLDDASLFGPGDELALGEPPNESLLAHVFVKEVRGNTLLLEQPAQIDFAAWPEKEQIGNHKINALIWALFPLVHAANLSESAVQDLTIRGHGHERIHPLQNRYTLAGIHIFNGKDVAIERVAVRDWPSDGISLQAGSACRVVDSEITGCRGNGLHPGTHLTDSLFEKNTVAGNGVGLYFCWYNQRHRIVGNRFVGNKGGGITGLGNPSDTDNLIENNLIAENGGPGIEINGGRNSKNVIRGNTIENNSRGEPGMHPGILLSASVEDARNYTITGNTIRDTQAEPTQHVGIEEKHGNYLNKPTHADENIIKGNTYVGHKASDVVVVGKATICEERRANVSRRALP